jgi:hypothetical protein
MFDPMPPQRVQSRIAEKDLKTVPSCWVTKYYSINVIKE